MLYLFYRLLYDPGYLPGCPGWGCGIYNINNLGEDIASIPAIVGYSPGIGISTSLRTATGNESAGYFYNIGYITVTVICSCRD